MNDLNLPARQPLRVLPWWVVLIGMAAVAVAIFVTLRWLLPIAGKSPALRIDAIKTGLSVGAGAGGTHFTHGCAFEDTEFMYRNCRSSWPAGWHLQPVTDTISKLKRSEQVFFGIARHPAPDAARIRASDRGRKLPT